MSSLEIQGNFGLGLNGAIVRLGWLRKQSTKGKWQQRFFFLLPNGDLCYTYKSRPQRELLQLAFKNKCERISLLTVRSVQVVEQAAMRGLMPHTMRLQTASRTWYLAAAGDSDIRAWRDALVSTAKSRGLSLHAEAPSPAKKPLRRMQTMRRARRRSSAKMKLGALVRRLSGSKPHKEGGLLDATEDAPEEAQKEPEIVIETFDQAETDKTEIGEIGTDKTEIKVETEQVETDAGETEAPSLEVHFETEPEVEPLEPHEAAASEDESSSVSTPVPANPVIVPIDSEAYQLWSDAERQEHFQLYFDSLSDRVVDNDVVVGGDRVVIWVVDGAALTEKDDGEEEEHTVLYSGDVYLVLARHTRAAATRDLVAGEAQTRAGDTCFRVHLWLGADAVAAQGEGRLSVGMAHAAQLAKQVGCARVQVESQGRESDDFVACFLEAPVCYRDGARGQAPLCRAPVRERLAALSTRVRCYELWHESLPQDANFVHVNLIESCVDNLAALRPECVYVLHVPESGAVAGHSSAGIHVLVGELSHTETRARAMLLSNQLSLQSGAPSDARGERHALSVTVHLADGLRVRVPSDDEDTSQVEATLSFDPRGIVDPPPLCASLWRVSRQFDSYSFDYDLTNQGDAPPEKSMLSSRCAYVLSCDAEVFVWVGRQAPRGARTMAEHLAARILSEYPAWVRDTGVEVCPEGAESPLLQSHFAQHTRDWVSVLMPRVPESTYRAVDGVTSADIVTALQQSAAADQVHSDIQVHNQAAEFDPLEFLNDKAPRILSNPKWHDSVDVYCLQDEALLGVAFPGEKDDKLNCQQNFASAGGSETAEILQNARHFKHLAPENIGYFQENRAYLIIVRREPPPPQLDEDVDFSNIDLEARAQLQETPRAAIVWWQGARVRGRRRLILLGEVRRATCQLQRALRSDLPGVRPMDVFVHQGEESATFMQLFDPFVTCRSEDLLKVTKTVVGATALRSFWEEQNKKAQKRRQQLYKPRKKGQRKKRYRRRASFEDAGIGFSIDGTFAYDDSDEYESARAMFVCGEKRCAHVPFSVHSLRSDAACVVCDERRVFLWLGRHFRAERREAALRVARRLQAESRALLEVRECEEPALFWQTVLSQDAQLARVIDCEHFDECVQRDRLYAHTLPAVTHLLVVKQSACSRPRVHVYLHGEYSQQQLNRRDSAIVLAYDVSGTLLPHGGTVSGVTLWHGDRADQQTQQSALSLARALQHGDAACDDDSVPVSTVTRGQETRHFQAAFPVGVFY
ncbi:MAG: hypothetical protein MHM6MM_005267 [Cercozoa sp. M6MM]